MAFPRNVVQQVLAETKPPHKLPPHTMVEDTTIKADRT